MRKKGEEDEVEGEGTKRRIWAQKKRAS